MKILRHTPALSIGFAAMLAFTACGGSTMNSEAASPESGMADADQAEEGEQSSTDIVDTAMEAGTFSTLLAAATAAGLVDTLKGDGPLTLFAPTDEAFEKLPEGTVEDLLKPENQDKLVAILTYHVVSGDVSSEQVVTMDSAATVQGADINISASDDGVMINEAKVVTADIDCSNGVIHGIDAVLMPPA